MLHVARFAQLGNSQGLGDCYAETPVPLTPRYSDAHVMLSTRIRFVPG